MKIKHLWSLAQVTVHKVFLIALKYVASRMERKELVLVQALTSLTHSGPVGFYFILLWDSILYFCWTLLPCIQWCSLQHLQSWLYHQSTLQYNWLTYEEQSAALLGFFIKPPTHYKSQTPHQLITCTAAQPPAVQYPHANLGLRARGYGMQQ